MGDVSAEFGDLFDQGRTGVAVGFLGHHENRFHLGIKVAVHQRHVEFEFKIRKRPQAADDRLGLLLARKLHEQTIKTHHIHIGQLVQIGSDQLDPLFRAEEGVFRGADRHSHGDAVKQPGGALEHVEVAIRDRIKSAGAHHLRRRQGPHLF